MNRGVPSLCREQRKEKGVQFSVPPWGDGGSRVFRGCDDVYLFISGSLSGRVMRAATNWSGNAKLNKIKKKKKRSRLGTNCIRQRSHGQSRVFTWSRGLAGLAVFRHDTLCLPPTPKYSFVPEMGVMSALSNGDACHVDPIAFCCYTVLFFNITRCAYTLNTGAGTPPPALPIHSLRDAVAQARPPP